MNPEQIASQLRNAAENSSRAVEVGRIFRANQQIRNSLESSHLGQSSNHLERFLVEGLEQRGLITADLVTDTSDGIRGTLKQNFELFDGIRPQDGYGEPPSRLIPEGTEVTIRVIPGSDNAIARELNPNSRIFESTAKPDCPTLLFVSEDFRCLPPSLQAEILKETAKSDIYVCPDLPSFDFAIARDAPSPKEVIERSPYSSDVTKYIRSEQELKVYTDLGLQEDNVNGQVVLKNPEIDPNAKDSEGQTNLERMKAGKPPIGSDGKPMQLHHIGQKPDSPLAEITATDHDKNSGSLHDSDGSEVNHNSKEWRDQRAQHWKARASDFES